MNLQSESKFLMFKDMSWLKFENKMHQQKTIIGVLGLEFGGFRV